MKNDEQIKPTPLAYLITCRTYATWLHGDKRSSVDRNHNIYLTPKIKPNIARQQSMQAYCSETPFIMNTQQRKIVLQSVVDTCQYFQWYLHAAHVRSNHMHIVVKAEKEPEKMAVSLKAYATRYLKKYFPELNRKHFWSKGQSTGYLFDTLFLLRAIQYTAEEQGKAMALYCDPTYDDAIGKTH